MQEQKTGAGGFGLQGECLSLSLVLGGWELSLWMKTFFEGHCSLANA